MIAATPRVAILESRMRRELARLVEKHGGEPVCVPAVRECQEVVPAAVRRLIGALEGGEHDIVVFMTGVAVSLLFEIAEQLGLRSELVAGLAQVTTVCR